MHRAKQGGPARGALRVTRNQKPLFISCLLFCLSFVACLLDNSAMVFLVGFVLGVAGLSLLIAGEVRWLGGKKVPARTSRQVGAVLVGFFPLVLLIRFVVSKFEADYNVDVNAYYWSVVAMCLTTALIVLIRGLPASRKPAATARAAFRGPLTIDESEIPKDREPIDNPLEPKPPTVPKRKSRPAPQEKNPFDFNA
jgi:hypothetical protein